MAARSTSTALPAKAPVSSSPCRCAERTRPLVRTPCCEERCLRDRLGFSLAVFRVAGNAFDEAVGVEGLREVVDDAAAEAFEAGPLVVEGGEDDDGNLRAAGLAFDLTADFEAVQIREH